MYLDLYSKDGHRYIRISESVRVKKNGTRVTRKKVIKNIGPVSRYDDGKPNFEQRLRDSFKGFSIKYCFNTSVKIPLFSVSIF